MFKESEVIQIIYQVIDSHNSTNPSEKKLNKDKDTIISGINGSLDSLGMITFLIEVETKVNKHFKTNINIFNEELLMIEDGDYKSVGSLANYILNELN